jgi:hypothetical protein
MNIRSNWWDKLGKPQYGGELNIRLNRKIVNLPVFWLSPDTDTHWLDGKNVRG